MKRHHFLIYLTLLSFLTTYNNTFSQNVGISETAITPDASSILEIRSTDKGVLIPRIQLTSATDVTTISNPANSMLVYNISSAGTEPNNVISGYYYWSTDQSRWLLIGNINTLPQSWLLVGNSGTNPTNDFIGTTDLQDLVFKTSNLERMRVKSTGNISIGGDDAWGKLTVNNGRIVVQNETGYSGTGLPGIRTTPGYTYGI